MIIYKSNVKENLCSVIILESCCGHSNLVIYTWRVDLYDSDVDDVSVGHHGHLPTKNFFLQSSVVNVAHDQVRAVCRPPLSLHHLPPDLWEFLKPPTCFTDHFSVAERCE